MSEDSGSPELSGAAGEDAVIVALSEQARAELSALVRAVDDVHGRVEFAVLLLGRDRAIERLALIEDQHVSVASFVADRHAVERSVIAASADHPGLAVLGIGHRHPGLGSIAVGHSATDEEHLLSGLLDQICARNLSWVEHEVAVCPIAAETPNLGDCGGDRIRIELTEGNSTAGARLHVRVRQSEALSLVFDAAGEAMECIIKTVSFAPLLDGSSDPQVVRMTERTLAKVVVEEKEAPEAAGASVDAQAIEEQVRKGITVMSGSPLIKAGGLSS